MNDTTRTLLFVGIAGVLAVAAFGMHAANQPPSLAEFSDVGEEFYPQFDNPRDATGLRVAAYNEDAARVDVFNVDFKNGMWRIPSHHDYPADGEERLASTATSIIGLQRGALASTSADDHKRLGVLDPLDETIAGTEGRGDRITLTKGDQTLADYIIGTKVDDGPENTYHIRRADENRTYRATLDLDVSTKFADWIEPDLLDFRRGDIRELVVDRYSIDETRGVLVPGTQSELTRASQDDDWTLKGIDEKTQKVKVATVNQMINALEDLKIVGVRPKPAGLSADLRGEGDGAIDGRAVIDLEQKGFFIDSRGALVSNEGDVRMATADGAMYVLRFGEVFTGSDVEIEIGKSSGSAASADVAEAQPGDDARKPEDEATADGAETDNADDAATDEDDSNKVSKSRYVFITAQFDESVIATLPEKPVKPQPPAESNENAPPAEETEDAADTKDDAGATDEGDKPATEEPATDDDAEPDDDAEQGEADKDAKPDPKAEYEQALADYETNLKDWEARQKEREEKIDAGQKRVQELNDRFADWYYVISAETFDKIRVSPEELVEAVEPETDAAETSDTTPPAGTTPDATTTEESTTEDQKPDASKPTDQPEQDAAESDKNAGDAAEPSTDAPSAESTDSPPGESESSADDSPPADDPQGREGT